MAILGFGRPAQFKYPPIDLSTRVFRLIRLLPPKPSLIPGCYGTLRIELVEAEIGTDGKPSCEYDAISYHWGDTKGHKPNRLVIIEVGGESFSLMIYRPLELALLHFVENKVSELPLFADQICINQQDTTGEKAHQVSIMRDIYSNCNRVMVWLGPGTRGSDKWFDFTREVCHNGTIGGLMVQGAGPFMEVFDAVVEPSTELTGQANDDRNSILELFTTRGDQFPVAGFIDVLDRAWFNRLWTIQEACLAPHVVFLCGNKSLCMDCFRAGVQFYNIYNTYWVRHLSRAVPQSVIRQRDAVFERTAGVIRVSQERKAIHTRGTRQSFYDIVLKYNVNDVQQKIGAHLPEDRIFGLLGLTARDDPLGQRVRVRYEKTDEAADFVTNDVVRKDLVKIYTEVATLLLEHNIDTLLFTQAGKMTAGLPSWVPDWAMKLRLPISYTKLNEPVFAAGGPKDSSSFEVRPETGELTIKGTLVDEVVAVGKRTYRAQADRQLIGTDVDHAWTKHFFDEVAEFVREAAASRREEESSSVDERSLILQSHRVCDSGLSHHQLVSRLGTPAGIDRLELVYNQNSTLGQRLINSAAFVQSYGITRIYRTVGITPWYFYPPPHMEMWRTCAQGPRAAAKVVYQALRDFVEDMVGLCVASARVYWASYYIKLCRQYGKVTLRVNDEAMQEHGFDPQLEVREDMAEFGGNILKNAGRKVYRTRMGYVGIGPPEMTPGDVLAVFHGGSTPHLLTRAAHPESRKENEVWNYVGEAYCDGIMSGEALTEDNGRSFTLV